MSSSPIEVAILGATGVVGQKAVAMLEQDSRFKVTQLAASERNKGKRYCDAMTWMESLPLSQNVAGIELRLPSEVTTPVVISALPAQTAREVEPALAERGIHVFSNASAFRMNTEVPLLIPEINRDHLSLVDKQSTKGKIVTNPNCSTVFLSTALAPLKQLGRFQHVDVVTLQSVSGAGASLAAYDINANTIPNIGGEEEKIQTEVKKILGTPEEQFEFDMLVHVNRVPVLYGHTLTIHVTFEDKVSVDDVYNLYHQANEVNPGLYELYQHPFLPQPVKNLGHYDMRTHIGRIKQSTSPNVIGMTVLGHNLVRGAAGAAIYNMNEFLNWHGVLQ
ncbi:MAG: aspartate-semialdehyde dehydrogenase [Halobacteriovoraceae bacterium]|nr:aspartate-semialdehyde dehydrogenase [Halobacteriovoraceae bacterium]MCB9093867.1 aspartate-semialdehyde dehydrogenase [Halobacteriovoraceae bacterium]